MPRKQLLTLFMGCLSGIVLCTIASCGSGPKITVYLSDPANGGMEFYNENTGEKGFVDYSKTEKFVAMTPTDAQTLFNYCGLGK